MGLQEVEDCRTDMTIKHLSTEVGLWRLKAEQLEAENKRLREALENAAKLLCDRCSETNPCDGGDCVPCAETAFIEQALKGEQK